MWVIFTIDASRELVGTEVSEGLSSVQQPLRLDDNDTFQTSEPFLVLERIQAIAYHISIAPPRLVPLVNPPSVSMSALTTLEVEKNTKCTAKHLQGPPPDIICELLQVKIDLSKDSPLNLAMKGGDYFIFRSQLTQRTTSKCSGLDENEDDYLDIVQGSLKTLIALAAVSLLQLWIDNGASDDTQVFYKARDILMSLESTDSACLFGKCRTDLVWPMV